MTAFTSLLAHVVWAWCTLALGTASLSCSLLAARARSAMVNKISRDHPARVLATASTLSCDCDSLSQLPKDLLTIPFLHDVLSEDYNLIALH